MPVQPTYPGVYVEEIPSGVRTITGVSTSVAAFIGYFKRGPMDEAVQIFSMGDFEREFGGLHELSEASYAIQQFFLNGGTQAYVVRVAAGSPQSSGASIGHSSMSDSEALNISATNEGTWGDNIGIKIDHDVPYEGEFNMVVTEYGDSKVALRQERFLNLSMSVAKAMINDPNSGSKLIWINATGDNPPAANGNGTISGEHEEATVDVIASEPELKIKIGDVEETIIIVRPEPEPGTDNTFSLSNIAEALQNAIRIAVPGNPSFANAIVNVANNRLQIVAGETPESRITFSLGRNAAASQLLLTENAIVNSSEYSLGNGTNIGTAQLSGPGGIDGLLPDEDALLGGGIPTNKKGIYALEDADMFNILCIPRTAMTSLESDAPIDQNQAVKVIGTAESYCEQKRAFFVIDTPQHIDLPSEIKTWREEVNLRGKNAALYFPRLNITDPLSDFRIKSIGACGTIAGLYSTMDSNRGVWKAPAGTEARLRNVANLTYTLSDRENGDLNPLAINCLRNLPVYGNVCWGARTLEGADANPSDWKYISVRRLALFLEESLFRGTQWVVFEPNDEPLWAQIRLNVGAFMNNLFKQGAFQGNSPRGAYLVKCNKETTTQNDINLGIVNIVVGFAPLKPAEFVFIKIQQLAGQIQS